jgi:hypothetical protein
MGRSPFGDKVNNSLIATVILQRTPLAGLAPGVGMSVQDDPRVQEAIDTLQREHGHAPTPHMLDTRRMVPFHW